MAQLQNYHTDKVLASWQNVNITGYANDTFIEVERNEDSFTLYVGSLGEGCRTKNLNRSGKITITLMASSPINDLLAQAAQTDEDSGLDYGPLSITDLNGNMVCFAAEAWVMKRPKIERAKEAGTVQWVFEAVVLELFEGGNVI
ncbi:MAG TPA: phage protein [Candidatus Paceibacterota bacterium]